MTVDGGVSITTVPERVNVVAVEPRIVVVGVGTSTITVLLAVKVVATEPVDVVVTEPWEGEG